MSRSTRRGCLALALLLTFPAGQLFAQTPKDKPAAAKTGRDQGRSRQGRQAKTDRRGPLETYRRGGAATIRGRTSADRGPGGEQESCRHRGLSRKGIQFGGPGPQVGAGREVAGEIDGLPGQRTEHSTSRSCAAYSASGPRKTTAAASRSKENSRPPWAARRSGRWNLKTEQEAVSQIAQSLLAQKAKARLPEWLVFGFGRATVLHVSPAAVYAAEKRKARILVIAKKRTSKEIWMGSDALLAGEAAVLRAAWSISLPTAAPRRSSPSS